MNTNWRSVRGPLLLAAVILGATALSLLSARSLVWALAGPLVLAAGVIVARMIHFHSTRVDAVSIVIGAGLLASATIVALVDRASVPMMMPILAASASAAFLQRNCARPQSVTRA
jgi:hypothetical protein